MVKWASASMLKKLVLLVPSIFQSGEGNCPQLLRSWGSIKLRSYRASLSVVLYKAISWREQGTFLWNNDVRWVFDQRKHSRLDLYGASSLKQQSVGRHVAPHYLYSGPTSCCSLLLKAACLAEEQMPIV